MDKVKQILKHQFWILLVIALILPLVGWSLATSGLVSEAAARTEALKKLNDSLKVGPDDPNNTWEQALQVINQEQGKQAQIAQEVLYKHQSEFMVWPDRMPSDPALINSNHQEFARTSYRDWVEQVRQVVKPYDENSESGLVEYSEDLLPRPDLEEWVSQAPTVKQIQAAQEDLWLLTSMLKAIASVNNEATTRFDAPIRRIEELYLRGGSKAGAAKPAASMAPTMSGPMSGPGGHAGGGGISPAAMMAAGYRGAGTAGSRDSGGATAIAPVKFSPDEDLGPESAAAPAAAAGGEGRGGSPAGQRGSMPGASAMAMTMGGTTGGTGGRWGGSTVGRYREEKPEWKTRGFYLEVVMDHRRVPDLLVALANADWPVNVLRVQMSDYQDEDLADADGGSGMPGSAGMMAGFRGGSGGGHGAAPSRPIAPTRSGVPTGPAGHSGGTVGRPTMPMPRGGRPTEDGEAASPNSNRSALDDPNLANVAIVGTIYIFNKPKPAAAAPGGALPATTPASPTAAPAAVQAATPAADPKAETGKSGEDSDSEAKSAQPAEDKQPEPEKPADPASDSPDSKPPVDKPSEPAGKSDQSS